MDEPCTSRKLFMAAPMAIVVVYRHASLDILSPQVKSAPPQAAAFGCGRRRRYEVHLMAFNLACHKPDRLDLVPRRRFLLKPMLLNTTDRQDFLVKRALRVRSITLTPFLLTPSFPDPFVPSCHDKGKYSR